MSKASGEQLREERERANVLAYELGAEMGVHSSRISQIEALATVTTRTATRYRVALASLLVAKTAQGQPQEVA